MKTRELQTTKKFRKSFKKLIFQNKDKTKLVEVINLLIERKILPAKYKNHKLVDSKMYQSCYECHIEPDWLLIYKITDNDLVLIAIDTGSHSELFKK